MPNPKRFHIRYNDQRMDLPTVAGIVSVRDGTEWRDVGRIEIERDDWDEFVAILEPIATFAWGFN